MLMRNIPGYNSKQSRSNLCPGGSYCVDGKTRKTNVKSCGEKHCKEQNRKGTGDSGIGLYDLLERVMGSWLEQKHTGNSGVSLKGHSTSSPRRDDMHIAGSEDSLTAYVS